VIEVTTLDGRTIVINAELIERLEMVPETVLSLTNGKKILVRESIKEVVDRIIAYKRRLNCIPEVIKPGEDFS
jgi:flagellar protein FlbD